MGTAKSVTKKQLLKVIDELQNKPNDRGRILGDIGITSVGVGLGAAGATTIAVVAGATTIPVLTTLASWIGITAVATTPIGWVVGASIGGGVLAYGVSRLIYGGGISEGRKKELHSLYQERLYEMKHKERLEKVSTPDRIQFIAALRELVDKNALTPQKAFALIDNVENGRMAVSDAYSLIDAILREI